MRSKLGVGAIEVRPRFIGWRLSANTPTSFLRGPFRHLPYPVHAFLGAYHRRQPHYLFWWVRLAAWSIVGTGFALLDVRLVSAGIVAFELVLFLIGAWQTRSPSLEAPPGRPSAPSGDREPRNPAPSGNAGAVALEEPLP